MSKPKLKVEVQCKPYNTIEIYGETYDDYALTVNGESFELSVCRDTHMLFVNKFGE